MCDTRIMSCTELRVMVITQIFNFKKCSLICLCSINGGKEKKPNQKTKTKQPKGTPIKQNKIKKPNQLQQPKPSSKQTIKATKKPPQSLRSFKVLGLDPEICLYRAALDTSSSGRKQQEPVYNQHYCGCLSYIHTKFSHGS